MASMTTDAALLPILHVPDPRLRTKAKPVDAGNALVPALAERMLATMYKAPGIGLAAPQVGESLRLVVIDVHPDDKPDPLVLVNPEIVAASKDLATREEGCLSLPNQFADVTRPARVKARWLDLTGTRREVEAEGLLAACLQHEIDHLDGILFVDHITALRRNMILRKLAKELKAKARE
jgi:peptide deformylase